MNPSIKYGEKQACKNNKKNYNENCLMSCSRPLKKRFSSLMIRKTDQRNALEGDRIKSISDEKSSASLREYITLYLIIVTNFQLLKEAIKIN